MDISYSLPAEAYLLAYDLDKDKQVDRAWLDYLVRAASLAQLLGGGYLVEVRAAIFAWIAWFGYAGDLEGSLALM